jgi:DNA-binding MarR family transcriptional regulator
MATPFGPQLIGETEKTLNALLYRHLAGTGLTEPQWVTLRLAQQLDGTVDAAGLTQAVRDRARFPDAGDHVAALEARGLVDRGRLTDSGRGLLTEVQTAVAVDAAPIFDGLPADDVAATTRVLNEVVSRARVLLAK